MQEIQKVIRIPMNSEYYEPVIKFAFFTDSTEYWFDRDTVFESDGIRGFVTEYDPDIFKQLDKGEADYLAIYLDR